jgi:hypothetical protein
MENKSINDETFGLVSFLVNRALNDPNGPEEEKIVLPDECGDTMWNAVLQQEVKSSA